MEEDPEKPKSESRKPQNQQLKDLYRPPGANMHLPPTPPAPEVPAAYKWMRFFLWCMPAVGVVMIAMGINFLRIDYELRLPIFWILIIGFAAFCGFCDAKLRQLTTRGVGNDLAAWTIMFCLWQIIVTPAVLICCLFGFCAFNGFGYR